MSGQRFVAGVMVVLLTLVGGVFASSLTSAARQDATPPVVGTPLFDPAIGLIEAQELALAEQSGAVVTAVELEGEEGTLVWAIEFDNGAEVEIDGTTGAVLEIEQGEDDGDDDDDEGDDDEEDEEDEDA